MVICSPKPLAPRWLQRHLDRLHDALGTLRQQVREALARVVSDAASKAVREVIHALAGPPEVEPAPYTPPPRWSDPSREKQPLWDDSPLSWSRGSTSAWDQNEDDELAPEEDETAEPLITPKEATTPTRKSQALALGLQAAAWWLRRKASHFPIMKAVGLGTIATVMAYLAGPVVAGAGVGLLGSMLGLFSMS